MRRSFLQYKRINIALAFVALCLLTCPHDASAQSGDPGYPAPVYSNEISGRIAPRDIGDSRRTRHFYIFRGTEGDVLVTLEGSELVGDLDVFTATTQRPLIKITLLGDPARVTKSFYVRKEETLILRVEARAVGDVEGTYRITFGGSFATAPTDLATAPAAPVPPEASAERRGKNTRRVTSAGARIAEPTPPAPPAEVAKEKEKTPAETADAEKAGAEKTAAPKPAPAPRRGRGTRTGSSRTRAETSKPKPKSDATKSDASKTETAETKSSDDPSQPAVAKPDAENKTDSEASAAKKPAPRRRGTRTSNRNARSESAAGIEPPASQATSTAQPAPASSQRLVIVTKDGETLERDMSTVRRVTVENNQLVVITKDGKVSRQPMANVLRMSIEP